jgi:hypothetical protein
MMDVAVNFYKTLFAKEPSSNVKLGDSFWDDNDLIISEENELLTAPFTETEIRDTIFSSYPDGAPRPDGLPFLFYQKFWFWDIVKSDTVSMFVDFQQGSLDLKRLKFALVTLIPKVNEASNMKQFRPISLINYSFKMFAKLLRIDLVRLLKD